MNVRAGDIVLLTGDVIALAVRNASLGNGEIVFMSFTTQSRQRTFNETHKPALLDYDKEDVKRVLLRANKILFALQEFSREYTGDPYHV